MTATATASLTTIEFGSHTMTVDHGARAVRIFSDSAASDRAAQRDWKAVCRQLDELGVVGLTEVGSDRGTDMFAGTF